MSEPDVLADALRIEGLAPAAIDRVHNYLKDHDHYVTENWLVHDLRRKTEWKAVVDAEKAAAFAKAIPYAGAIKDCQATVWSQGRGASAHRCNKRARFVVRRAEDRKGDGRLAVCRTHAEKRDSYRYVKHWSYEVSADEAVEPEYQP